MDKIFTFRASYCERYSTDALLHRRASPPARFGLWLSLNRIACSGADILFIFIVLTGKRLSHQHPCYASGVILPQSDQAIDRRALLPDPAHEPLRLLNARPWR